MLNGQIKWQNSIPELKIPLKNQIRTKRKNKAKPQKIKWVNENGYLMRKMKWVPYAVFNYFPSLFSCTGIKYIGDPVDGIRFKSGQYRRDRLKNISFDFSQEEDPEAIDTVDVDARKNFKGKKIICEASFFEKP